MCNGQIIGCNKYIELYKVIGRKYIPKTMILGNDLFCVPDMKGRVPVGVDSGSNRVTFNNTLGGNGGEEFHTLTVNEMPSHAHSANFLIQEGNLSPRGDFYGLSTKVVQVNTNNVGGNQSHNNMPPYLVLNYLIKH